MEEGREGREGGREGKKEGERERKGEREREIVVLFLSEAFASDISMWY